MKVDYNVAMEVASHEALVRQSYRDSGGTWTWSVGLTSATGHKVERYIGKPQPLQHCLNVYVWALRNYAEQVREVFDGYHLTQAQFAAAVSFHWNTGAIRRATWVNYFKANEMTDAERAFKYWNKASGEILPGLSKRRAREAELLFRDTWSHDGAMTEYTQLTTRSTPDWDTARRIDVATEMRNAFDTTVAAPKLDQAPRPDAVPAEPTLTPEPPEPLSWFAALIAAIKAIFSKG